MTEQHPTPDTLDERDLAILQFEATWFMLDEDRHDAIRARFACSVEDYNLDLNRVIDLPAALLADQLVMAESESARGLAEQQFFALAAIPAQTSHLPLRIGMTGEARVLTGRRTLLELALEPMRALRDYLLVEATRRLVEVRSRGEGGAWTTRTYGPGEWAEVPGLDGMMARGDVTAATGWLREKLQRHGALYEPREVVRRACGFEPSEAPLLDYLEAKFGGIYGV